MSEPDNDTSPAEGGGDCTGDAPFGLHLLPVRR